MSSDVPLLERLSQLPPVAVGRLLALLEGMARPENDPLLRPLLAVDEEGERAVNPLLAMVLQHLEQKPEGTCYQALLEALTGIWNAAVRAAAVSPTPCPGAAARRPPAPPPGALPNSRVRR